MGYSWSYEGVKSMLNALIHHLEGTLIEAIQNNFSSTKKVEKEQKKYPSVASLLREETKTIYRCYPGSYASIIRR